MMAGADYKRGEMDVSEQERTFSVFMRVTVWSTAITGLALLYLTFVIAAGFPWMPSLAGVAALGIAAGAMMRMSAAFYGTVIGLTILTAIISAITALLVSLNAG